MRRTLHLFYLYTCLSGLTFSWTTWFAFVAARGGNPGWAESAFHIAILLGEVPTGVVADLLGRGRSMLIGLVLNALSLFCYPLITGTVSACLVLGLSGLSLTFLSGADTALLYEAASAVGGEDLARRSFARASALQMAALAAAPVAAGWLYQQHPLAPFLAQGLLTLLAAVAVWRMAEPHPERSAALQTERENAPQPQQTTDPQPGGVRPSPWRHARAALVLLRRQPALLGMIAFAWAYDAAASMVSQFGQVYLPALGLSMLRTGMVFSLARLLGALGGWVAGRMTGPGATRWLRWGPLAQAACLLAMGTARPSAGVAGLALNEGMDGLVNPLLSARINQAIPSEQRATVLSFQSLGASLLVAIAFPAAAALPAVEWVYLLTGGALAAAALAWALRRQPAGGSADDR